MSLSQGFPITITLDEYWDIQLSQVRLVVAKMEAWINFQALKAGWYANEDCVLSFEFKVVSPGRFSHQVSDNTESDWFVEPNNAFAFVHDSSRFLVRAIIPLDGAGFESTLKSKLVEVANLIVKDYGLRGL